jgi:hypothetical protein
MNIIRLTKGQKRRLKVDHPLLDQSVPMTDNQAIDAWNGNDRDALIMGHLYLIKIMVGRFLANWPETRRFTDDMISEGILALTETLDDMLKMYRLPTNFQGILWVKVQNAIEEMLNRDRSMFAPPTTVQWEKEQPEYNYAKPINEQLDGGESSYDPEFVDILDELDDLAATDREALRAIILQCMEQDHGILESEITEPEMDMIERVTRAITEM